MGQRLAHDLGQEPAQSAEELPLPATIGHLDEARARANKDAEKGCGSGGARGEDGWRLPWGAALRALLILALSALVLYVLENPVSWSTALMMSCAMVPGFAGSYLCSRASSKHSLSTAGFLLCTWLLGLVQADAIQDMETMLTSTLAASLLVNEILHPIQDVWLILLSVQRLSRLQKSAGHEFIPHLKQLFRVVGAVYIFGQVGSVALAFVRPDLVPFIRILQTVLYSFVVWLCIRILFAYREVLQSLHKAREVAERTCDVNDPGCQGLKRARWAMRKETWGVALCFASTLVSFPCARVLIRYGHYGALPWILSFVLLGNTLGTCFLSNAHRQSSRTKPRPRFPCPCAGKSRTATALEEDWQAKVEELSMRGVTARALLRFYKELGKTAMPHYQVGVHTTNDVVRQVIIPRTRERRCAYAELMGGPLQPERMVTHSWRNLFRDLVAAVIADAVGESSFGLVAALLDEDVSVLEALLRQQGTAERVYWICAFAVNQHAGICENVGMDQDSATGEVHPACDCGLPKMLNNTPPLSAGGQSIGCEMNKFDDMMALLAQRDPDFSQVVAVDAGFALFSRAWCVAELVKADEVCLKQHVKMHSREVLEDMTDSLRNLRVEDMEASRAEDVDFILNKIECTSEFNRKLQVLIFDKAGLLSNWRQLDAAHRMDVVKGPAEILEDMVADMQVVAGSVERPKGTARSPESIAPARDTVMLSGRFDKESRIAYFAKVEEELQKRGIRTFMVKAGPGEDFGLQTARGLVKARVLVAFCSSQYGQRTGAGFETFEELRFVQSHQREISLLPVKLCEVYPPEPPDEEGRSLCQLAFAPSLVYINGVDKDLNYIAASDVSEKIVQALDKMNLLEEVRERLPDR
ncbi:unnamed protein product [Symbiodinium natans]|uniref:TIR domain-containing protein n=1 Tax=Symbiodinium natans TaxID=878477 RepID=A0A812KH91_9DINO|nr:unnamed protein product [Symbiodinium natans]